MWSVRMRASGPGERHVSGAEGIYLERDLEGAVLGYARRALEAGGEDVVIGIERLKKSPRRLTALPLRTVECRSPSGARQEATRLLRSLGISAEAAREAFGVLRGGRAMRGAALMDASSGRRLEPDTKRGVRASMLGMEKGALNALCARLGRLGINHRRVVEALTLATKAAFAPGVVAELCASDDPGYTTGYVASRRLGYVRITNIKRPGSPRGGRVFFLSGKAAVSRTIKYLEESPVIVSGLSGVGGA